MSSLNVRSASLVSCAAALGVAGSLHAGLLGSTLTAQYYWGGGPINAPYANGVVNGSVLGTLDEEGPVYTIAANDTQVIFDFSVLPVAASEWNLSGVSLDSDGLFIRNGTTVSFAFAPAITGVTIDASSNMVGLDQSRIPFNAGALAVDWVGLGFDPNTRVVLNIFTGVPDADLDGVLDQTDNCPTTPNPD
ncbi:MAG: thrombospondin type 3 repeat-containing protein, partial [Planctomycetota bacterium]